jgi:phosphatidylserine decarboxylase
MAAAALRVLPRALLSRLAGRVADLPLPPALLVPALRAYGRAFGVRFDEIRDPLPHFPTFQQFFTRALVPGARPIDSAPDAFVAPCDGRWGEHGIVREGTLLQVKGRPYPLAALLASERAARTFEGGTYATFYLAPGDYHRFHAPCDLRFVRATYVPGTLWPVNRIGLEAVDGLFAQNERICAHATVGTGDRTKSLALVAVGATVVGRIRVAFDDRITNRAGARLEERPYPAGHPFAKGEEWGRFELGSTIVMIAEPGALELDAREPGTALRLGQRIGTLRWAADPPRTARGATARHRS